MGVRWSVVLVLLAAETIPCSKSTSIDASQDVAVGAECTGEGDPACGSAGVCVLGYCRLPCDQDDDCPQDALCIGSDPFGCQLTWDAWCTSSQPCGDGMVCGQHSCRMPCQVGSDNCPREDQECLDGECYGNWETNTDAGAD